MLAARCASEPTVVMIFEAPNAFASIVAVVPIPDAPPWISTLSPALNLPRWNRFSHTVRKVSGIAAASTIVRPSGTASVLLSCATAYSA